MRTGGEQEPLADSAEEIPGDTLRVISIASLPPPRLRRWVLPSLIAAGLLHVLTRHQPLPVALGWAPTALGMVSAAALASWFERRLYGVTRELSRRPRMVLRLLQPFAILVLTGLLTALIAARVSPALASFIAPVLAFGGLWHAGYALGTITLAVVDALVRRVVGSFRARLVWVTFILVLGGYVLAIAVGLGAVELYRSALADPGSVSRLVLQHANPRGGLTLETLAAYPAQAWGSLIGLAGLLALPAVLSACGKLADTALEMLRPLAEAFRHVGRGERDVRVQVGGSVEFAEVARAFNGMVRALGMAERMERAFGAYVSGHLLERIRAQHGEAALPPSLREASVFFADIRGFTGLSERLSPEAMVGVLNRYFENVVELVEAHQGYLNKFIGDAVVVVFNGPLEQPDHAERAMGCALALQAEVARLNREGAFPEVGELKVGIGVTTGPMVCGNIGSSRQMEYTVIGDTVNLASRLTDLAPAGEIWASEGTVRALPFGSEVEPLPELQVKGKEAPVRAFRVRSLATRPAAMAAAE